MKELSKNGKTPLPEGHMLMDVSPELATLDEESGGRANENDNRFSRAEEDELSDPERAEKYGNSGDDKIADGDYQGAIKDLSEAIRLDPQNCKYCGLRGVAYYEMGRYKEAIEDESKEIETNPDPATLFNRAESYYKTGKDSEALDDLDHALKLANDDSCHYFIIPECHKLISIIRDKSISREDYYQAPIGWEKENQSTEPDYEEFDDVGPEVISFVYTSMRIDDEWSIMAPRGFTWWGHQLAQRIWADDCRKDAGVDVTLVHVETDFLRHVETNQQTHEALNDLNAGASQFAFIYDPEERCIRFHSTVYTHRQNLDWSKRLFLKAVGLQVSYAQRMAESFSHLFTGSEPDTSPHPDNGFRQDKDELVNLIDNFFIPMGEKEPPFESGTFKFTQDNLLSRFMVTTGDKWLTAEFPFSGDEPVSVRLAHGKLKVVTSLFRVNSEEGHPLLGRGLMMRMMLPVSYGREGGLQIAMALNLIEAREWAKYHMNGAWCVDEQSNLVFTSFSPITGFKSWELVNLTLSCAKRSKWAGEVLAEGEADHPPKILH
jgi:tetratricopeptide (TPR) repeat protein